MKWERIFSNHTSDKRLPSKYIRNSDSIARKQITQIKMSEGPQQTFLKKTFKEPTGIWKKMFNTVIIRKMEIKTTMWYRLMSVRIAFVQKIKGNRCWWGCREKATLVRCCWECKLVQTLWKTIWSFLKRIKISTTIWSSNYISEYISKGSEMSMWKKSLHTHFNHSKAIESAKCPSTDEWI
jgi:hypothetical protein